MANRDQPSGLKPVYHLTGGEIRPNRYKIASAYGQNIWTGDLVVLDNTSKQIIYAGDTGSGAPYIGVFAGCWYTPIDGVATVGAVFSPYWPTGTVTKGSVDADCLVYDDPNIVFEIQADDGGSDPIARADIGQDADPVRTHTSSTAFGISTIELDSSNAGTGDALHIIDIVDREDNAAGEAWTKLHVLINEHQLRTVSGNAYVEV